MIDSRYFRDECYINGEWVGGGGKIRSWNPATGKVIGSTPRFGRAETAKAIDAAHAAFPAWRPAQRPSEPTIAARSSKP
ncbi:MAG: aldehyde dehydrogenase family protein [Parvularculaceae bacterium]